MENISHKIQTLRFILNGRINSGSFIFSSRMLAFAFFPINFLNLLEGSSEQSKISKKSNTIFRAIYQTWVLLFMFDYIVALVSLNLKKIAKLLVNVLCWQMYWVLDTPQFILFIFYPCYVHLTLFIIWGVRFALCLNIPSA